MIASIQSSFIAFVLTSEEEVQAYEYTDLQIAGIQNLISAAAEEILRETLTEDQLSLEAQKKLAYTKGQIDILKCLLARADVVRDSLQNKQDAKEQFLNNDSI